MAKTKARKDIRLRSNQGLIYLSVADLAKLMGTNRMRTAFERHKSIREALAPGKRSLTIREYCRYENEDFEEVWGYLRE